MIREVYEKSVAITEYLIQRKAGNQLKTIEHTSLSSKFFYEILQWVAASTLKQN